MTQVLSGDFRKCFSNEFTVVIDGSKSYLTQHM